VLPGTPCQIGCIPIVFSRPAREALLELDGDGEQADLLILLDEDGVHEVKAQL
jgi:hypothetical protein